LKEGPIDDDPEVRFKVPAPTADGGPSIRDRLEIRGIELVVD